jgi:hypothetical protein
MPYNEGVSKRDGPAGGEAPRDPAHSHYPLRRLTVDNEILARSGRTVRVDEEREGREERSCFYCLEGWVFLDSLGHDGEEVFDAVRCRKCGGTGQTNC